MIHYRDGYAYQLCEDASFPTPFRPAVEIATRFLKLTEDGTLTIRADYCWDGPSGPTVDSKSSMQGALVHDALYQLIRLGHLPISSKAVADEVFYNMLLADGMAPGRARLWYRAVCLFGDESCLPESEKDVLTAP